MNNITYHKVVFFCVLAADVAAFSKGRKQ